MVSRHSHQFLQYFATALKICQETLGLVEKVVWKVCIGDLFSLDGVPGGVHELSGPSRGPDRGPDRGFGGSGQRP